MAKLAAEITAIDTKLTELDHEITAPFNQDQSAEVLLSMPGFGPVLVATFLANIGGNLEGFDTVDRLACVAGLAPVPRDSGRIHGNLPSTSPLQPPSLAHLPPCRSLQSEEQPGIPNASTSGKGARANPTNKHSSPSHAAASTLFGPCSVITPPTENRRPPGGLTGRRPWSMSPWRDREWRVTG